MVKDIVYGKKNNMAEKIEKCNMILLRSFSYWGRELKRQRNSCNLEKREKGRLHNEVWKMDRFIF